MDDNEEKMQPILTTAIPCPYWPKWLVLPNLEYFWLNLLGNTMVSNWAALSLRYPPSQTQTYGVDLGIFENVSFQSSTLAFFAGLWSPTVPKTGMVWWWSSLQKYCHTIKRTYFGCSILCRFWSCYKKQPVTMLMQHSGYNLDGQWAGLLIP